MHACPSGGCTSKICRQSSVRNQRVAAWVTSGRSQSDIPTLSITVVDTPAMPTTAPMITTARGAQEPASGKHREYMRLGRMYIIRVAQMALLIATLRPRFVILSATHNVATAQASENARRCTGEVLDMPNQ